MKNTKQLFNLAVSLSDDVTTVRCIFEGKTEPEYTYLCRKDIASALEKGDRVVVERNGATNFTLVEVVGVDEEVELPSLDISYVWIIQKVDTATLTKTKDWLNETVATLRSRQRKASQEAIARELGVERSDILSLPKLAQ